MAFYLFQTAFTANAVKAMVDHPQNREEASRKLIESLGGKLHSFYFAFGEYDTVIIAELPGNVASAGVALAASAGGALSKVRTTPLITTAESMQAMEMAKKATYAPPK